MAWPYVIIVIIGTFIFLFIVLTLPLAIYYSRRANEIEAKRIHRALHEQTPAPPMPYTYEQRAADRAERIAKELDQFDERLKSKD